MKIPFDIKYRDKIESGEYKVKTADGRNVRIICWDKKTDGTKSGAEQIVALVSRSNGLEKTLHYDKYGTCMASGMSECPKDLFLVTPEEELTPFEQALKSGTNIYVEQGRHMEDWDAKEDAKELLDIANKQLCENYLESPEAFKARTDAVYKQGVKDGKAESEKDMLIAFRTEYEKGKADTLSHIFNWIEENGLKYYNGLTLLDDIRKTLQ